MKSGRWTWDKRTNNRMWCSSDALNQKYYSPHIQQHNHDDWVEKDRKVHVLSSSCDHARGVFGNFD